MKHYFLLITAALLVISLSSCNNSLKPKEGKLYVQIDKGLMLPVPDVKDSTKLDYSQVKVTFESDGVYMRSKAMIHRPLMSIEFKEPQLKTSVGWRESNTRIGLDFQDSLDGWNIYFAPYSELKKYTPYWTWDDVEGIRFVYRPESFKITYLNPSDFENKDDYYRALENRGFQYEITIYRDHRSLEMLNDPDFDDVFTLFRAHLQ